MNLISNELTLNPDDLFNQFVDFCISDYCRDQHWVRSHHFVEKNTAWIEFPCPDDADRQQCFDQFQQAYTSFLDIVYGDQPFGSDFTVAWTETGRGGEKWVTAIAMVHPVQWSSFNRYAYGRKATKLGLDISRNLPLPYFQEKLWKDSAEAIIAGASSDQIAENIHTFSTRNTLFPDKDQYREDPKMKALSVFMFQ